MKKQGRFNLSRYSQSLFPIYSQTLSTRRCVRWLLLSLLFGSQSVLAGPGGYIASTLFDSFWGKILLVVLFIVFLPLITLNKIKKMRLARRTKRDLQFMREQNANFDWLFIKGRAEACFNRIHQGWQKGDLEEARHWMTEEYWTDQQETVLDNWASRGLENVCNVKKIRRITPTGLIRHNPDQNDERSLVIVQITANMQDYLVNKESGEIVEGNKVFKDVTNMWVFRLVQGRWLVCRIDPVQHMMQYVDLILSEPDIRTTAAA